MEEKKSPKSWLTDNMRLLLVAVIAAFGSWFATYSSSKQYEVKSNAENNQQLINNMQTQINNLSKSQTDLNDKIGALTVLYQDCINTNTQLQIEKEKLKTSLLISNADMDDLPYPFWVKDLNSKMLYLNKAYDEKFLKPNGIKKEDYVGGFDHDVWPDEIAAIYRNNDKKVINKRGPITSFEDVKIEGTKVKFKITKYPIYVGGRIVAVAGIANYDFK